jgi:hypothetical protein
LAAGAPDFAPVGPCCTVLAGWPRREEAAPMVPVRLTFGPLPLVAAGATPALPPRRAVGVWAWVAVCVWTLGPRAVAGLPARLEPRVVVRLEPRVVVRLGGFAAGFFAVRALRSAGGRALASTGNDRSNPAAQRLPTAVVRRCMGTPVR